MPAAPCGYATESTPTTWPSTSSKSRTRSSASACAEALERRVAALERRIARFEEGALGNAVPPVFVPPRSGAETPDEFNPFWDDAPPSMHPYGVHAFPEKVLQNRQMTTIGTPFEEQCALFGVPSRIDWARAIHVPDPPPESFPVHDVIDVSELVRQLLVQHSGAACVALQHCLKDDARAPEVVSAVRRRLIPLASDTYGRFVVHRALGREPDLAWQLQGSFAILALSPHGALVVQRVLEVAKDARFAVVHELLQTPLAQTLLHPCAAPVWQTVWALPWDTEVRAHIAVAVHAHLQSRWLAVATDEVGSVLVQDLLRNGFVSASSACVAELLDHFVECVCDQYGVWVIQHLAEHGGRDMQDRIAQLLLRHAATVCLSPFGAKAVQVILRVSDASVSVALAERLCTPVGPGAAPSARPLLVDVALTQQGLPILAQVCGAA
ncbi:hypothetical protein MBRA1_003180 [Malassezia brasiliensis]|uniref:PUM-HD domain-containing protein n=1 Tax=Malassezia brasiliensis TaxID=1821822 RepID=A0AAF0DYX7_9BASI|nr:hypothetical protein MBRA1_003180 [Malassezia brasiliensis]